MNARIYAALDKKINEWLDEECCNEDWPDVIVGERTADMMGAAARAVFEACEESQAFSLREGYTSEPE